MPSNSANFSRRLEQRHGLTREAKYFIVKLLGMNFPSHVHATTQRQYMRTRDFNVPSRRMFEPSPLS